MDDLISRQAAIDALGERPMVWMDSDYEIAQRNQYDMDKLAIETVPTVDAVPVVHGAWRSTEGLYTNGICYCSVCETEYYFSDLYDVGEEAQSRLPNFCPHCGAMMNWEEVATDNARMDGES